MEFKAQTDIEAPIDFVFERATDFTHFEHAVMRRGAEVDRISGEGAAKVGTKWNVRFKMRGKERMLTAEIVEISGPDCMKIAITSPNLKGSTVVQLVPLAPKRARMSVTVEAAAKSIAAKLLFQSMRFARGRTQSRFDELLKGFGADVEARYKY